MTTRLTHFTACRADDRIPEIPALMKKGDSLATGKFDFVWHKRLARTFSNRAPIHLGASRTRLQRRLHILVYLLHRSGRETFSTCRVDKEKLKPVAAPIDRVIGE